MSEQDSQNKKYKSSVVKIVIGALMVFLAVMFVSQSEAILPEGTETLNYFIGAAIVALVGWIVIFIGIIGIVRHAPNKQS